MEERKDGSDERVGEDYLELAKLSEAYESPDLGRESLDPRHPSFP